jgi:hypothetical protein
MNKIAIHFLLTAFVFTGVISCTETISFDRYNELAKQHCDCLKSLPADGSAGTCVWIARELNTEAHNLETKLDSLRKDDFEKAEELQSEWNSLNDIYMKCQIENMQHLISNPE